MPSCSGLSVYVFPRIYILKQYLEMKPLSLNKVRKMEPLSDYLSHTHTLILILSLSLFLSLAFPLSSISISLPYTYLGKATWGHGKKKSLCKTGRLLTRIQPYWHLDLELPTFWTVRKQVHDTEGICGMLLWQPEQKTPSQQDIFSTNT